MSLTKILLHAILNTQLATATACESEATACDIEINSDMHCIGFDSVFQAKYAL